MSEESSVAYGVKGTTGAAAQAVATTKYSVGTAFRNKFGNRYAAITVKCNTIYTLYVFGSGASMASAAGNAPAAGALLDVISDAPATSIDGRVWYVPIAGMDYVLPCLYQASGGEATVTLSYHTLNGLGQVGSYQGVEIGDVQLVSGTASIGSLVQPSIVAETIVAGASSTLGKIGTSAQSAILYVRVPCAASTPATSRAHIRIKSDKIHSGTFYATRSVLNAPTITLASAQANDTVIVNGLTFTAHADTTVAATGQFSIAGSDEEDAHELVTCINTRFAALGLSATHSGGIVTLTATTATATQCVTGVGGARIVCAQTILASLNKLKLAPHFTGAAANSSWNGDVYEVPVDGYPHIYVALVNTEAAAATFEVGAALLPW